MAISGNFIIDARKSTVEIRGSSSVHPIHIRSRAPEGELTFADGVGFGTLVIPVKTLRGDTPLHDIELRRQLQPRRFPTIVAAVRHLTVDAAEGDITFRGSTQPARGPLSIREDRDELVIVGEATFDVRDFGYAPPNVLGVKVHPEVTVRIDLVAVRR